MNYREAVQYIEQLRPLGIVMGLETTRRMCARLGNPQDKLKFVHIAGTNGKGSTLAYISNIMMAAGYRTGCYSSPAVREYRERFQVNGRMITQSGFCKYLEQVRAAAQAMEAEGLPGPTVFEAETLVAFLFFLDKQCDIVVLETGLGGALDTTNVVENTLAAVFSSISMDHMAILGDSLDEIASAKAGIIKNKCYVISVKQSPEVMKALRHVSSAKKGRFLTADVSRAKNVKYGVEKQSFDYDKLKNLEISMPGQYQIENAVLAVETALALGRCGFKVPEEKIREGLLRTKWRGRFDVLAKRPLFIADGAHNEDAAKKLAESIRFYFTNRKIIYIMGVLKDKEYDKVIRNTFALASHIITVTPPAGDRALSALELAQEARMYHSAVTAADSVQEAVEIAYLLAGKDKDAVIIAFGSLSYLGELMDIVGHRDTIRRDSHGRSEKN